jgi:formamidopyrimidine-DNA glycosylase
MPELPEVQCVVNSLASIARKKIKDVEVYDNRLREPIQPNLKALLSGRTIKNVERRAKCIIFNLDKGSIVAHLGMTGKFLIQPEKIDDKFNRVCIEFEDGTFLMYNDIRKFGFITHENTPTDNKFIKNLGIEPLTDAFTGDYLYNLSRNVKKNIKQFLLDQTYVVGLGNIYVIELMYICSISPYSKAMDLTKKQSDRLVKETKDILNKSIEVGGSSISDYRDAFDQEGSFQDNFHVYGKKVDTKGHPVTRIKQGGRGTYYCPICQDCP